MMDKVAKGRQASGDKNGSRLHPDRMPRGEKHGCAKLTEEDVVAIIARYASGAASQVALSKEYGVTQANISSIVLGKSWTHVTYSKAHSAVSSQEETLAKHPVLIPSPAASYSEHCSTQEPRPSSHPSLSKCAHATIHPASGDLAGTHPDNRIAQDNSPATSLIS